MTILCEALTVFIVIITGSSLSVDAVRQHGHQDTIGRTPTPPTRRRYKLTTPQHSHSQNQSQKKGRVLGLSPIPPYRQRGPNSMDSLIPPKMTPRIKGRKQSAVSASPSPIIQRRQIKAHPLKVVVPHTDEDQLQRMQPIASKVAAKIEKVAAELQKGRMMSPQSKQSLSPMNLYVLQERMGMKIRYGSPDSKEKRGTVKPTALMKHGCTQLYR